MPPLPDDLEGAIAQARTATQAALADGLTRLQVELVFPELKIMPVATQFLPALMEQGQVLKVLFPDTGAAALAKRDWGSDFPYPIDDLGNPRSPVERKMAPEDGLYLVIEPSAVEVAQVERLCQLAEHRPVILLNPRLEDAATIGIGLAGRQLRDRFLSTLESCYYLRPLAGGALLRAYPSPWQVWRETPEGYEPVAEVAQRPLGDDLERLLFPEASTPEAPSGSLPHPKRGGLFAGLDRFLKALSR